MIWRLSADTMIKERKRLALMAHVQHALRRRGIQELARHGCTDDEIANFSGHATNAMIEEYAGAARTIICARQAQEKRR